MSGSDRHALNLLLITGRILPFTRQELRHALGAWKFHAVCWAGGFFWLSFALIWGGQTDFGSIAFTYAVVLPLSIFLTIIVYFGCIELLLAMEPRTGRLVPEVAFSLVTATMVLSFQIGLFLLAGKKPLFGENLSWEAFLFHLFGLQVTVLLYAHVFRPFVNVDFVPDSGLADDIASVNSGQVVVGGVKVAVEGLEMLEARDHYVALLTASSENEVRARFADVLAEVSHLPGRQIHRSIWIKDAAVSQVRRTKDGLWLILTSGREVKVARARRIETETWLRSQGLL